MHFHAPQIIWVVICALDLGVTLAKHGEPKKGTYSIWSSIVGSAIFTALLFCGGFFRP